MQRIVQARSRLPVWFLRLSLGSRPGRPVRGAAGSIRLRLSRTLQLTCVSTQKLRGYFAADPHRGGLLGVRPLVRSGTVAFRTVLVRRVRAPTLCIASSADPSLAPLSEWPSSKACVRALQEGHCATSRNEIPYRNQASCESSNMASIARPFQLYSR